MLTLNQIVKRIKDISESHGQVRSFQFGEVTDFLNDKNQSYPAVFVQDQGGTLNISSKDDTLNIKMFFLDAVNVAGDAKENELDVQSDMLTLAKGIVSMIYNQSYTDWSPTTTSNYQIVREEFNDLIAGVTVDLAIRTQWNQSYCEEPL